MDYEQGLTKLEELLTNAQLAAISPQIALLRQMVKEERRYGPAPESTQKLYRAIDQLNQFMLANFKDLSFNDLCRTR